MEICSGPLVPPRRRVEAVRDSNPSISVTATSQSLAENLGAGDIGGPSQGRHKATPCADTAMAIRKRYAPRVFTRNTGPPNGVRLKTLGADEAANESSSRDERTESTRIANEIDVKMGFERYEGGRKQRIGWLINMHSTMLIDEDKGGQRAAVDYYFLDEDGGGFKATLQYNPYFLIACRSGMEAEVEEYLRRRYEDLLANVVRVTREDLRMPNHLLGYRRTFLQLQFHNVPDLLTVRRALLPVADANKNKMDAMDAYNEVVQYAPCKVKRNGRSAFQNDEDIEDSGAPRTIHDAIENVIDAREWDVPYHIRVAIDKDIRVGRWYTVKAKAGQVTIDVIEDRLKRADPVVLAFDIETSKSPLKFPDATVDAIMMISYMIDGQGFLITNREIVSADIDDFDYTPKPEFEGPFTIINAADEKAMLAHFFDHIKSARPTVISTYNGDFFDWPFVEQRAALHGINMYDEIGFKKDDEGEYKSRYCAHMDCLKWVKRDSYLPQGSQGLKAVTTAKLGYDPLELDPEVMTKYAYEQPQTLAQYSVSDAVATYYLYMKYVHPFIFSLCNIIPMNPDDVLRKGSGTLCETLLMVQAYKRGIVLPNKHVDPPEKHYDGHLLESETYVGGHVEALEAGVFRKDIPIKFEIDTTAIDELLRDLDSALKFSIEVESKKKLEDVENYDEVKAAVAEHLQQLKDNPSRMEKPKIYHLDVSAMYPNIMITNRLQPDSMIDESVCASCDFNRPGKTCDRRLPWSWRGEFFPAKRDEYNMLRNALRQETFPGRFANSPPRKFDDLPATEQATHIQKRLSDYCRKVYHKIHETEVVEKEAIICQRENPFYIDTVKSFRDRRYEYKGQHKTWKNNLADAEKVSISAVEEAKAMVILFDSLQLAHKVILNSFYGYVMRKGSRWYSMEMAGVTCLTGASLIQMARALVERVGRPLELDTDGIWCVLPDTFPENFQFKLRGGKNLWLSYPCAMLNHLVHAKYTNDQYAELVDPVHLKYKTTSENSIFFEIDGPYRAMILPASKEEDKNLKKRYAVFNDNGSLAELKGFEVKRRGELKLIKIFQTQIFKVFLEGTTLEECYSAVAKVANRWLDVLFSKGRTLADEELLELISENRSMSKVLEEYGSQKSTSITTAKRLAEFLGDQMVKDKGLACKYIISSMPKGSPVTERAIPVAIFSAEPALKKHFLRLWLKDNSIGELDLRSILDWDYYIERLGGVVQKLITIPAAMQRVDNPVPKVAHPDWLRRRVNAQNDKLKQKKVTDLFKKIEGPKLTDVTNLSSPMTHGARSLLPAKRKELHSAGSKENESPDTDEPEPCPSTDDYPSWIAFQKKKWRQQRQARAHRRQILGARGLGSGLGGYFKHQSESLFTQKWEIIQLRETEIPGQLKAFALIDSRIVSVKINAQRKIYINFESSDLPNVDVPGCEINKVVKLLPNGNPSVNLFELSMPEHVYGANVAKFRSVFNHHSVEGVYERQIPLKARTLLDLGTTCHVHVSDGTDVGQAVDLGFDVAHLKKLEEQTTYLQQTQFQYLYLYKITNGRRHVFGLCSSVRQDAVALIVDSSKDSPDVPNLTKIYSEQLAIQQGKGDMGPTTFEYSDRVTFDTSKVRPEKVYSTLAKVISRFQAERKAPTILVIDSKDSESLMKHLPALKDYPILSFPGDKDHALPAVGWLAAATKQMVSHFLRLSSWIAHRMSLARYGNVPLCDFEDDETKFLTDILFARRLADQNVVLWWSPTPYPDLGGRTNEDPLMTLQDVETPEFNTSGCYTTVCIELEIRNLQINTILTSALINELEGSDAYPHMNGVGGMNGDEEGSVALSDSSFSSVAVSVLKSMVKHWWDEASIGNSIADLMVLHLLRWIQSTDACMYDRSLHRHIEVITKKALLQLMGEFKKMGSKAVYASPTKIMLLTTKSSIGVAYAYANYVVKAIKSKPLFGFLDLSIREYWDYLLWMDQVNFGGKACTEIESSEDQKLDTVLNWHIKSFLPLALQQEFQRWVIEFIDKMHEDKDTDITATPRIPTQFRGADPLSSPDHRRTNDEYEIPSGVIDQHFAKPLINRVKYLIRKQNEAESHGDAELLETFAFPDVPGSTLRRNPTLQFVKYLCAIFSLSKEHHLEARMLRRDLLSILDVAEFSKEGIFSDPSESFKMSEVVCSHCGSARDLDFCKDADLLPDEGTDQVVAWRCIQCHHEYSQLALQERMVMQMQALLTTYQLQDLKCSRCKQVRGDELSEHCVCSGEWVGNMGMMEVRRRLGVFKSVAEFYRLDMLRGAVEEVFLLADM